ncbi:hypothetical protein [Stenotrophomonas chelatiphaga]|jgi:hypothetical protein|nr:hypothetical protein [Stenotrophomonas chelatiphaga]
MMLEIVFAVGFASVIIYLILFFRFARRFPSRYPELWRSLDCPETFGLRGQSTYLAVVLGLERKAPPQALTQVRREMLVIRVLLGLTLAAFVLTAFMTG